MRRTFFWTCPECGANLDPGEKCDCWMTKEAPARWLGQTPQKENLHRDYTTREEEDEICI
jgi:hypothetical protein